MKQSANDDIPHAVDLPHDDFIKYRGLWLLWRALGHYSDDAFVAPISFIEALQLPKSMLDTFFELDSFLERMKRHQAKKRGVK